MTPDRYDVPAPFDPEGLPEHMCTVDSCRACNAPLETCCTHCPAYGTPKDTPESEL